MNRREFEQTAPKLRERIVGMVSRIIGDEKANQAEDVAQDTLLRLWTMREKAGFLPQRGGSRHGHRQKSRTGFHPQRGRHDSPA